MVTEFLECPCKTLAIQTSTIALTKKHSDDIIEISNCLVLKEEMIVNYLGRAWILKLKVEVGIYLQGEVVAKEKQSCCLEREVKLLKVNVSPCQCGSWNHSPVVTWN